MSGGVRGRKFLNQRNFLLLDFIVLAIAMRKMHVPVQVYLTTANQSEICAVYFIFGKFLPETRCVSELLAVELTELSFF